MMEEIIKLIESRNRLAKQAYTQYEPLVNSIIDAQNKDVNHISLTLDYLLGFCFDDNMLMLYRHLCRYLYDLDKEDAVYYVNAYREMWDEEGKMFGNFDSDKTRDP